MADSAHDEVQLSILVPCYNEELNLPELAERSLRALDTGGLRGELVLVDDASTDGTRQIIEELAAAHPQRVIGVFHGQNRGVAAGWSSAHAASHGRYVVTIDADLQYQPEDVLRLYRALIDHSVDVVQGWRSALVREKESRYFVSRAFAKMLNVAFGMSLRDNKSGFVCCSREVFADLLTYKGSYAYWQSFVMVAAHAKGYSYREVETLFEARKQGESFLDGGTARASFLSFVDVARALVEYRSTRFPRDLTGQFLRKHGIEPPGAPPSMVKHPQRWRAYMATFRHSHWMITSNVERVYETLNTTQWLDGDKLRQLQDEKLRRLVRHVYRNVPYYRHKMQEAKLRPEDIRGQQDLHRLPLLSKEDVRANLHFDITADNVPKSEMLRISTSGSTGEPFVCYADRRQLEFRWAATLRAQEWTGYRYGDPCVRLWHQTLGMSKSQSFKEQLDSWMSNRTHIPVFEMSTDRLDSIVRTIEENDPTLVDGYAEAFDLIAHYIEGTGRPVDASPGAIMSSAQTLPDASRKLIEDAFGCRVFDKYGSREFSGIAYECEAHDGLHAVAEGYIIELLVNGRPAKPGETGEVVITDLNNYGMPFIRYRIGDLALAREDVPCSCGRGAPRIGAVQGRVQSIIQGTEGRFVPGTFFAHALKEFDYAIRRFQVVQERPGHITFKVVKAGRYSDGTLEEALHVIREHLGEDLNIDTEIVESIDMVRTGKHMAAVSRLPMDFQKLDFGSGS